MYMDLIYEASSDKLIPASASLSELSNYGSGYDYMNCLIVKTYISLKIIAKQKFQSQFM